MSKKQTPKKTPTMPDRNPGKPHRAPGAPHWHPGDYPYPTPMPGGVADDRIP